MNNNYNKIITQITRKSKRRVLLFNQLEENKKAFILTRVSPKIQYELAKSLTNQELIQLLSYLDPDETTDILQNVSNHRRRVILKKLEKNIQNKVEFLLKFNPKTAAGLMSIDYIEVEKNITFNKLAEIIKKHEKRTGKMPTILVVEEGFLVGEIQAHFLAIAKRSERITKYIKKVPSIKYEASKDEIINVFKTNPHNKVIVLGEDFKILGIIYSDDILRIIDRHSTQHLSDFAGINDEEDVLDSPLIKVKNRYRWLIVNLMTAFLAASVVGIFESTIAAFTLLAVYMPIVAGMGGNAGTQTLAVTVRGLALKEVDLKHAKRVILNEMGAGAINGIINGLLVAGVAIFWNKSPMLGLILGIAMIVNLIISGFFGAIIPLIMKSLGKDPATSATIFITTATDVLGFVTFLGLANLML